MSETSKSYDLITVDWDEEQTKVWLHYAEANCPDANIVLIKDTKPFKELPPAMKLYCFDNKHLTTDRVIYIDTDTIIFKDLGEIFDMMGDKQFALTFGFCAPPYYDVPKADMQEYIDKACDLLKRDREKDPLFHSLTGLMVFKGWNEHFDRFRKKWEEMFQFFITHNLFMNYYINDEISLSFILPEFFDVADIYEIPYSAHVNISHAREGAKNYCCHKTYKGKHYSLSAPVPPLPNAIHYHSPDFLEAYGMEVLLNV